MSLGQHCRRCGTLLVLEGDHYYCSKCPSGTTATLPPSAIRTTDGGATLGETAPQGFSAGVATGERFGDYEILQEIAHGGMGVVFKARQVSLGRTVALKMILRERLSQSSDIQRFQIEAQAAARLQHPNIVSIHEVGSIEGEHFYSMDFITGQSLANLIREHPLPPRKAVEYLRKVALAIDYAHREGVLHRDLKPANILVDTNDEPQVTDFGLAKLLDAEHEQTMSGTVLGTPSYMSPEQASGSTNQVTTASDVYSLGAILYELVTGRPPFRAESTVATLKLVIETDPVPPRRMNPRIPIDLETITLRCLDKQPSRRYRSAAGLAEDLRRFLDHEPIEARRIGPAGKLLRWCRRKPALAAVSAVAVVLLLVVSIGSPIAALKLNRALSLAKARELAARQNAYAADMNIVQEAIDRGNVGHALELLRSYIPESGQIDVRGWEWRHFWQLCKGDESKTILKQSGRIRSVLASPLSDFVLSQDEQGTIRLWNIAQQKESGLIAGGSSAAPCFSPDGRTLAGVDPQGSIRFWDPHSLKESGPPIRAPGTVRVLDWTADQIAAVSEGKMWSWHAPSGRLTRELEFPKGGSMAVTKGVKHIAISSGERLSLWSPERGILWEQSSGHIPSGGHLAQLAFSPDQTVLLAGVALAAGGGFTLQVWDVLSGQKRSDLPAHLAPISAIRFSDDGAHFVSTSLDQTAIVWETRTWRQAKVLKGHASAVVDAAFSPDRSTVITGAQDRTVKLWKLDPGEDGRVLALEENLTVESIGEYRGGLSPDNRVMGMFRENGSGVLVDVKARKVLRHLQLNDTGLAKMAIGRRGDLLAVNQKTGVIRLWRTGDDKPLGEWPAPGEARGLVFSARNKYLAASGADGFRLWDTTSLSEITAMRNKPTNATRMIFTQDQAELVCGQLNGAISIWRVKDAVCERVFQAHPMRVVQVALSWDGKRIASTSTDKTVGVFDFDTGRELARLPGGQSSFYRVSFSPDGSRLCVNEWGDGYLFDLAVNRPVARLKTFIPIFLDNNTVLGFNRTGLWHWSPPDFAEIDARERSPD